MARRVRAVIGELPLIVKVGHVQTISEMSALIDSLAPFIDAVAMTNSVAATVLDPGGRRLFDGQKRGVCGAATLEPSLAQVTMARDVISYLGAEVEIIGVGGVSTAQHVKRYLEAGASVVHLATAAMVDPEVGLSIRREMTQG